MKINEPAYLIKGTAVQKVVVVAKHFVWDGLYPETEYIVAPVQESAADIIKSAFYGSAPLEVAVRRQLVKVPPEYLNNGDNQSAD